MTTLTYEEMEEKYGEVDVVFTSYYKYSFTFRNEDMKLTVIAGGTADDVYRFTVVAGEQYKVMGLPISYAYLNGELIFQSLW